MKKTLTNYIKSFDIPKEHKISGATLPMVVQKDLKGAYLSWKGAFLAEKEHKGAFFWNLTIWIGWKWSKN
jgi:hypothetical protein